MSQYKEITYQDKEWDISLYALGILAALFEQVSGPLTLSFPLLLDSILFLILLSFDLLFRALWEP